MNGTSTLTQKGQIAIPKSIRKHFGLKPYDKVHFSIANGKILAQPLPGIDDMRGVISAKKSLSKKEYKSVIKKKILRKYAHSS